MSHTYTDNPVESDHDEFQRRPFAHRLADLIAKSSDSSSSVIGIYGAWGEGKTSVLKFIEEKLKKDHNQSVVPVWFNPWRYKNEDHLLAQYFEELANALDTSLKSKQAKIGEFLRDYVAKLIPDISVTYDPHSGGNSGQVTANLGKGVGEIGAAWANTSVEQLRDKVQKILNASGQRVVIFIDDIDRLDRDEIAAIFRLVKLTANFDHTTFVLAFDDIRVAQILSERYGLGDLAAGKSFLEKIVQLPVRLPKISEIAIRNYCLKQIDNVLKNLTLVVGQERWIDFVHQFTKGLQPCIQTPRMAKRYANAIAFALPTLVNEVDLVDLMLLEGIRVFYPKLYDKIYETRGFESTYLTRLNRASQGGGISDQVGVVLDNGYTEAHKTAAVGLVESLFPSSRFGSQPMPDGRVANRRYFDRFFIYAIPEDDIPDREIEIVIALLSDNDNCSQNDLFAKIESLARGKAAQTLAVKLVSRIDTFNSTQASKLAEALAYTSDRFMDRQNEDGSPIGSFWDASGLLTELIRLTDAGNRGQLIQKILPLDKIGALAIRATTWLGAEGKLYPEKKTLDDTPNGYIAKMICDRAIELLDKDVVLTPYSAFTDQIYWALHVWGELDQVKQYFASQLHHYADRRIRFLRVYLGVRRPFALWKDEIYEPISKLVDIHKLYQWLDPDYGLSSRELISTDPLTFKPPPYTDEEIALRFKWVYDAANPPSTNQTSQDGVQLALH